MRNSPVSGRMFVGVLVVALIVPLGVPLGAGSRPLLAQTKSAPEKVAKVPITTSSEQARTLYLQGRDLAEKLRATDARKFFEQAVAADKNFALGHLGLANTSGTNKEFIDALTRAASLAGQVSDGERQMILAQEAGLKGDPAGVLSHYNELVRLFPNDERAHTLIGNVYFGRQDYASAIKHFVRATEINPSFSQPYNQMGYAYRFLEKLQRRRARVQEIHAADSRGSQSLRLLCRVADEGRALRRVDRDVREGARHRSQLRRVVRRHRQRSPVHGPSRSGAGHVRQAGGGGTEHRRETPGAFLDRGRVCARARDRQGDPGDAGLVRAGRSGARRRFDVGRSESDGGHPARSGAVRRSGGQVPRVRRRDERGAGAGRSQGGDAAERDLRGGPARRRHQRSRDGQAEDRPSTPGRWR